MQYRYRSCHRLKTRPELLAILSSETCKSVRLACLKVSWTPNGLAQSRLMSAVPKRLVKRSVVRNAVKRAVRESFRHHQAYVLPCDMAIKLVAPLHEVREAKSCVRRALDDFFSRHASNSKKSL